VLRTSQKSQNKELMVMARGKGDGPKVKDYKRGNAANNHEVDVDGDGEPARPNFLPSGETLEEYLTKIAEMEDEKKAHKEKMRQKTEPERKKIADCNKTIKNAQDRLAEDGYALKPLQTLTRQYLKRREADQAIKELDEGQLRDHAAMEKAWKNFASIPGGLGEHASRQAMN